MEKGETVAILGCGWLGTALGKKLVAKGINVNGSVTCKSRFENLKHVGIEPFLVVLNEGNSVVDDSSFFDADALVVAIPPRRVQQIETIFPGQIAQLIDLLKKSNLQKIVFISSTSVYNETNSIVSETDVACPEKASGRALLNAENLLRQHNRLQVTIVRMGGLIGADRDPARFLLQKKRSMSASKPVNLIHQSDAVGILDAILEQKIWGETFNACCLGHPSRKDFYGAAARASGLPLPQLTEMPAPYKIVDSTKVVTTLNYRFLYPDPILYLEEIEKASIPRK